MENERIEDMLSSILEEEIKEYGVDMSEEFKKQVLEEFAGVTEAELRSEGWEDIFQHKLSLLLTKNNIKLKKEHDLQKYVTERLGDYVTVTIEPNSNDLYESDDSVNSELNDYKTAYKEMHNQFKNLMLYNSKLVLLTRLFLDYDINKENRNSIAERFDETSTIDDVRKLFDLIKHENIA